MPKKKYIAMAEEKSDASSIDKKEVVGVDLSYLVEKLAFGMSEMQASIAQLANSLKESQDKSKGSNNVVLTQTENNNGNSMLLVDKQYISIFKDLGGYNLFYNPNGNMHPMIFLKKLKKLFVDAGVPENAQINFAFNCLRGSAADWAATRENSFDTFENFEAAFRDRYWGVENERELFLELKYGEYRSGNRADYMLKMAGKAAFLTEKIAETELVDYLSKHFEREIQRAVCLSGIKTIDEFDSYLRKVDSAYAYSPETRNDENWRNGDKDRERRGRAQNWPSRRNYNNENNNAGSQVVRRDTENDNYLNKEVRVLTTFNESSESLLSDDEKIGSDSQIKLLSPSLKAKIFSSQVNVLVDSGSQITAISESFLTMLRDEGYEVPSLPISNTNIAVAIGSKQQKVKEQVLITVELNTACFDVICIVIPKLNRNLIFGCDWMLQNHVTIDFGRFAMKICNPLTKEFFEVKFSCEGNDSISLNLINQDNKGIRHQYSTAEIGDAVFQAEVLDTENKQKLNELIQKFTDVFSETPGRTGLYEHEILMRDNEPFVKNSYPVPFAYRDEVRKQVKEMIDLDIIKSCQTEYISPLVVVKKKDNSVRICLDARFLNSKMVKDHVTPPPPEELVTKIGNGQILSTVDLTAGYWQVPIKNECQRYTGFSFDNNTYCFKVLPFGLSTSVASFVRCLNKVLGPEFEGFTLVYVDDLLIFSRDANEHLCHLQKLFERFRECNLTIKLKKSKFARKELVFLGHIISSEGIRIDPMRLQAMKDFPRPRNIRELRGFLGVVNFERRFCHNFSHLTLPLLKLLKKGVKWAWTKTEQDAFDEIKDKFMNVTMVFHPNFDETFYIQSDSSGFAVGAFIYQIADDNNMKILAFASRTLRGSELNYSVTEKEALAIIYAFKQWRTLVLGRKVVVLTDHKALSFMMQCKLGTSRLVRWSLYLQEFDFSIDYIRGNENVIADQLSRNPVKDNATTVSPVFQCSDVFMLQATSYFRKLKIDLKNINQSQREEKWIKEKIDVLMSEQANSDVARVFEWFYLSNGLLFKKGDTLCPEPKICVPRKLIVSIVMQQHNDNGHFGGEKTFNCMKSNFFWPKMKKHIRQIVSACETCQKTKISKRCVGPLNVVVARKPGDLVCIDLVGPLPRSRSGVTQLFVVVDAFSRFVKLYPLKRATSKIILGRLTSHYFVQVGIPRAILSDNGTQFHSNLYTTALEKLNITVKYTSNYFPQGNITERVNREVGRLLRCFCFDKHTLWSNKIADVENCLNNVVHSVTGHTPLYLQFGIREPNNIRKILNFPEVEREEMQNLHEVWELAYERLKSKAIRKKTKFDSKIKAIEFDIGDAVLMRTHPLSSAENAEIKKFFLLYEGPYYVLSKSGPNSYVIGNKEGEKLSQQNVVNLKPYKTIPEIV